MKQSDKDLMRRQREDYKRSRGQQRQVSFVGTQGNQEPAPPAAAQQQNAPEANQIGQNTSGTVMGGRNEQAAQRANNNA